MVNDIAFMATNPEEIERYLAIFVIFAFTVYAWSNALYALSSPDSFLGARWTARRTLSPETSRRKVRGLGLIFLLMGAVSAWSLSIVLR